MFSRPRRVANIDLVISILVFISPPTESQGSINKSYYGHSILFSQENRIAVGCFLKVINLTFIANRVSFMRMLWLTVRTVLKQGHS